MVKPLGLSEAAKDIITATAGLALFTVAGMKLKAFQLNNVKTFAFSALLSGAAGAAGREVYNWKTRSNVRDQRNVYKLASLASFAAGALALTQFGKVNSLLRLPRFTSLNQGIAVGAFTITSMVACRYFFGGRIYRLPEGWNNWSELSDEVLRAVYSGASGENPIQPLTDDQKAEFNAEVEKRNKGREEETKIPLFILTRREPAPLYQFPEGKDSWSKLSDEELRAVHDGASGERHIHTLTYAQQTEYNAEVEKRNEGREEETKIPLFILTRREPAPSYQLPEGLGWEDLSDEKFSAVYDGASGENPIHTLTYAQQTEYNADATRRNQEREGETKLPLFPIE